MKVEWADPSHDTPQWDSVEKLPFQDSHWATSNGFKIDEKG